jgi:hypothetical protein
MECWLPLLEKQLACGQALPMLPFRAKEKTVWLQLPVILPRKIFEALLGGIIPLFVLTNQGYIYYPINKICIIFSVSIPLCLVNVLVYY